MSSRRKNIMLGTAGHVDHGKSALVKLLTGCETDTLAEEKQRGLTIDLGFAPCRMADERIVGVVDVPGHVDFIRNMVAGAHGIDVVIFVVAADDGIMPQTHEHLHILTLMGLKHGVIALTKTDLVDAARLEEVRASLRSLLAGTFLEGAPICPISNITGEGYSDFFDTLNEVVNACEDRSCGGLFKLWVEDVFTIRGSGTIVTGIPSSGLVKAGDALRLLPSDTHGRVRRMQVYGQEDSEARAGECVALNVPELDHEAVRRGMVLTSAEVAAPVSMAEAEFHVLTSIREKLPDYFEAHLHVGTASVIARVAMLDVDELAGGQSGLVQLRLASPLPLGFGERFVLRANIAAARDGITTVGGGRILGVSNSRMRRKKQWVLDALSKRRDALGSALSRVELALEESANPVTADYLARKSFLRMEEAEQLLQQLLESKRAQWTKGKQLVHCSIIQTTALQIRFIVDEFHSKHEQSAGITRSELATGLGQVHANVLDLALDQLQQNSLLSYNGTVYCRKGWAPRVSSQEELLTEKLASIYLAAKWMSPAPQEAAVRLQRPLPLIEKSLRLLLDKGTLIRLDADTIMHKEAVDAARQVVLRLFTGKSMFSTMEFRDAVAVSRKYAVPLLDYFDRVRLTVRNGHNRTPGVEARKALTPT